MVTHHEAWRIWLSVVPLPWFVLAPAFFALLIMIALKQNRAMINFNRYLQRNGREPISTGWYSGQHFGQGLLLRRLPDDIDEDTRRSIYAFRLWSVLFFANLIGLFLTAKP